MGDYNIHCCIFQNECLCDDKNKFNIWHCIIWLLFTVTNIIPRKSEIAEDITNTTANDNMYDERMKVA